MAAGGRYRVDAGRLLGAEPHRQAAGRRRDWQSVQAALERLADHHDRHHPTVTAPRSAPAAYGPATWAARNATAARSLAENDAGQHPTPMTSPTRTWTRSCPSRCTGRRADGAGTTPSSSSGSWTPTPASPPAWWAAAGPPST